MDTNTRSDSVTSTAAPSGAGAAPLSSGPKPLSCTSCRQRKVKCNKVHPCLPCQKSGVQCVFPQRVRVPRGKQGGSRARDSELLQRIGRLESLVSRVDAAKAFLESNGRSSVIQQEQKAESKAPVKSDSIKEPFSEEIRPGNLAESFASFIKLQESGTRYVGSEFWTTLGSEVDGLRGLLEQSQDDEEETEDATYTPAYENKQNSPNFILRDLGTYNSQDSDIQHPPSSHRTVLMHNYFANVHPVCHMVHQPTVVAHLFNTAELLDEDSKHYKFASIEAISFAMYFAGVTSMTNGDCVKYLGEERDALILRYKNDTEIALNRANFLNSMEIVTLTAFVLYLIAARFSNSSRSVWTLVGLAVRIAHSLNLHRDGDGTQFDAFEAEMRRRLWWQIIMLDTRSSEDRGSEPIIGWSSFTTRMPCNLNDSDFSYTSKHPLPDKKGWTEMTYSLMGSDMSHTIKRLDFIAPGRTDATLTLREKEAIIKECAHRIATIYTDGLDISASNPPIPAILGRVMILRLWSVLHYPFQRQKNEVGTIWPEGSSLRIAVNVLELIDMMEAHPDSVGFLWYYRTYVPWHPVAMALVELCKTPHGTLSDRAWPVVERAYKMCSERVADTSDGMLWKPVKKLYRRAQAIRAGKPPPSDTYSTPSSQTTPNAAFENSPSNNTMGMSHIQHDPTNIMTMPSNLPPIPGTENPNSYDPNFSFMTNQSSLLTNTPLFGSSAIDWVQASDIPMTGIEAYNAPINWDDWNNFVCDAGTGQNIGSFIYGSGTGLGDPSQNLGWDAWNMQQ